MNKFVNVNIRQFVPPPALPVSVARAESAVPPAQREHPARRAHEARPRRRQRRHRDAQARRKHAVQGKIL